MRTFEGQKDELYFAHVPKRHTQARRKRGKRDDVVISWVMNKSTNKIMNRSGSLFTS